MTDATWPDIPPELWDCWGGISNHAGLVYITTRDFSGSPSPVYGVIVSKSSETWYYGQWDDDDVTDGPE
jgi:hypothetical protein